ncbi:MAG: ShlB/FhaC/HecB family hemolysin secretion/activation protein [Rhodocyclaceae bacterium]|nr:ShlB/FhaC/HecB family hemolysin secretion/activation protein [Rhodocyclaceae bacterium]
MQRIGPARTAMIRIRAVWRRRWRLTIAWNLAALASLLAAPTRADWGDPLQRIELLASDDIPDDIAGHSQPYLGRPFGEADAEALRIELTRGLVDRGYVNSGYRLAEPAYAGGVLRLQRIAGRISRVQLGGQERLRPAYVTSRLTRTGETFNTLVLAERFRKLLNDPLFRRVDASIIPDVTPGEAVLDLAIERNRAWNFSLETGNQRPRSIGEYAATARASVANLSGWGDTLGIALSNPIDDGRGARVQVGWQVPLRAGGPSLNLAYDEGSASVIEPSVARLDITSRIQSVETGLSQVLLDTANQRLAASVAYLTRHNRTQLLGEDFAFQPGEPDSGTRVHDVRLQAEYARRSETALLLARASLIIGSNNIRPVPFPTAPLADDHHRVLLLQGQYARTLGESGLRGVARATLQRTPDRLVPLERIAVGGGATVRGFLENTLVRDEATIVNLELEWPLVKQDTRNLTLIPFIDYGEARNQGEASASLASAGLAGRLTWGGARLELAWGHRLREPDGYHPGGGAQAQGIHFNLAYGF